MPQDGSNNYQYPPGTPGVPDQTIESAKYNAFLDDLVTNDLNIARPIHRGGTGATTVNQALTNLTAERATQVVTNYDDHVWQAGSFYSASSATGEPVDGQAFVGTCMLTGDVNNITLEAVSVTTGITYLKQKIAGSWGAWVQQAGSAAAIVAAGDAAYVNVTGDVMTGVLNASAVDGHKFGSARGAAASAEVPQGDANIILYSGDADNWAGIGTDTAGSLWFRIGLAAPQIPAMYLNSNDHHLYLREDPTLPKHAVTRQYVDNKFVELGGDAMTGLLTLSGNPTAALHAVTKQYADAAIANATVADAFAYNGIQVNGSFEVSQDIGFAGTTTNNGYFCDGWFISRNGTMTTSGIIASSPSAIPGLPIHGACQVGTAQAVLNPGDYSTITQYIEGYRIARLGWGYAGAKPITIAFWSWHSPAGLYSVAIRNGAGDRSYVATYTQATASSPQYNVITIPGDTTGAWPVDSARGMRITFVQACGSTFTAPAANTWTAGSFLAAPGQVNGVAIAGSPLRLNGVVILPGSLAPTAAQSPLIMRPYDQELLTCRRYWQRISVGMTVDSQATGTYGCYAMYPVQPRTTPTITGVAIIINSGNFVTPSISPFANHFTGFAVSNSSGSGQTYQLSAVADARM